MILPISAFLLVSLLIGLYASRRIKGNLRNFFVGGNVIPFWVLVFSMSGQAIELGGTYDNAGLAMTLGFWDGAVLPIGIGFSLILIGVFFARPLHRMRLLTLPDFYTRRFDGRVGALVAILCVLSFIILIAGNLAGIGLLLEIAVGVNPKISVPLIAVLVMVYTMAGGLFAVTWNDVLQIGVAVVGFTVATVWASLHFPSDTWQIAINKNFSWAPLIDFNHGALRVWASLLALALGDIIALDFMERVFAARTDRGAQSACIFSGFATVAVGVMLAMLGMLASATMSGTSQPTSFLQFVQTQFPPGIRMLLLMAFLGAGISTIDGAIMACSKALSRNVFHHLAPNYCNDKRLLVLSRSMCIPVTILSVVLAIVFPVPADLLVLAFDVVFSGCLIPLALGIYWSGGGARAAYWAIVIPSSVRVLLHFVFEDFGLDANWNGLQTLIPPLLSVLIYLSIAIVEKKRVSRERA